MSEISYKIIKDYRENIVIRDVKFYKGTLWDCLIVKITDNNKKHFKNKTLNEKIFYNEDENLKSYVEWAISNYIDERKGKQIRDLENYSIVQKYKQDLLEEKGE